jgi:hypothetical protein
MMLRFTSKPPEEVPPAPLAGDGDEGDHVNFVRSHFDKLLLSGLFLTALGLFMHAIHHAPDAGVVNWLENTIGQILAALLTLMVGRGLVAGGGNGNGNGGAK